MSAVPSTCRATLAAVAALPDPALAQVASELLDGLDKAGLGSDPDHAAELGSVVILLLRREAANEADLEQRRQIVRRSSRFLDDWVTVAIEMMLRRDRRKLDRLAEASSRNRVAALDPGQCGALEAAIARYARERRKDRLALRGVIAVDQSCNGADT